MKNSLYLFVILTFIVMSCKPDPDPIPDPEPFNLKEYVVGSWEWLPYGDADAEHYVFHFEANGRYTVEWFARDTVYMSNNPTYWADNHNSTITFQMATAWYYDYLGNPHRHDIQIPDCNVDVFSDDVMNLTGIENPDNVYIFTRTAK